MCGELKKMNKKKCIAIITARGGSKRIPKKNIKEFCGKPIIVYSIKAALNSGVFDEVMVSTDSEEIAEIAKKYGAQVPFFRSADNSNDFATTSDVIAEVLEKYEENQVAIDKACCIYPTAPFITAEKLRNAMNMLTADINTVIPVVAFSYPPQRGLIIKDSLLAMREPQYARTRSQDLEPMYHDCGQFYCFHVESFLKTRNLLDGKICPLICDEMEVQDIDTDTDWELAEVKYRMMLDCGK